MLACSVFEGPKSLSEGFGYPLLYRSYTGIMEKTLETATLL